MLNPMAVITTAYRAIITPGAGFPAVPAVGVSVAVTLLLLILSYRTFERLQRDFADML